LILFRRSCINEKSVAEDGVIVIHKLYSFFYLQRRERSRKIKII
jgi:hypothetical protein